MTRQAHATNERAPSLATRMIDLIMQAGSAFLMSQSPRYPRLDLDIMEPHMKRDLGFLDGRDPRPGQGVRR